MIRQPILIVPGALLACLLGDVQAAKPPVSTRTQPVAEVTVELGKSQGVTFVGAFARWDADGNPRIPVDPKQKIDAPAVFARATHQAGNRWVFRNQPPGRYDLVILAGHVRVEGFHYPPIREFDPFLPASAQAPEEARDVVIQDIAKSRHYENKVTALYLAGDGKQVRVLVQLVRDQPTSYDAEYGQPVASIRHEVWQYTFQYGGWARDRQTKILDRMLMARKDLHRWTWIWEPRLGIEVAGMPLTVTYELPERFDRRMARGWLPE
jgi:hypothetical protein